MMAAIFWETKKKFRFPMSRYVQDFKEKNKLEESKVCFFGFLFTKTAISISSTSKFLLVFSGPSPRLLNRSSSSCGDCGDTGDCGELDLAVE